MPPSPPSSAGWHALPAATPPPGCNTEMTAALDAAGPAPRPGRLVAPAPGAASPTGWPSRSGRRRAGPRPVVRVGGRGRVDAARPRPSSRCAGRADRIERSPDGTLAILDYKTGVRPEPARMSRPGCAPQLPLEAAMAAAGAFGADLQGAATRADLLAPDRRLRARRGAPSCSRTDHRPRPPPTGEPTQAARAGRRLRRPGAPYLSQPHPGHAPRFSDYAQLARVAEWAALEEG